MTIPLFCVFCCYVVLHDIGLCHLRLSELDKAENSFAESLGIVQHLKPEEVQSLQISTSKICQEVTVHVKS